MNWRRRCWATLALLFAAFAGLLLWQHVRPWIIGVGPDEPLAPVRLDGKFGYVSERGVEAIPFVWDHAEEFGRFGLARVARDGQYGWIDRKNRVVIEPQFEWALDFCEWGEAPVRRRGPDWTWIDRQGREVRRGPWHDWSGIDDHGWARVRSYGKTGWIDPQGRTALPIAWEHAWDFDAYGWAPARREGFWGWIDRAGKEVLPSRWQDARQFDGLGWARVKSDGLWGWIDRAGKAALPARWQEADDFDADGWSRVKREGRWGCIDRTGKEALAVRWDALEPFDDFGWALANDQAGWRWIDRAGKDMLGFSAVVESEGPRPRFDDDGRVAVAAEEWSRYRLIDRRGEAALPGEWSSLHRQSGLWVAEARPHPLAELPAVVAVGRLLPTKHAAWFLDRLTVVHNRALQPVWRSDLHALRPILWPGAAVFGTFALLCSWRWRVAKRKAASA